MLFPKTLDELTQQGYRFSDGSRCRGCKAAIEWWITPANKKMPLDVDAKGNVVSHFTTCPNAADYSGRTGSAKDPDEPEQDTLPLSARK